MAKTVSFHLLSSKKEAATPMDLHGSFALHKSLIETTHFVAFCAQNIFHVSENRLRQFGTRELS